MQKRKNRPASTQRSDSSRPQQQQQQQQQPQKRAVAADGVYNNPIFIHAVSSQLGNTVQLQTKSGAIYEGIFTTFSPQFNVLLEMAHRVDKDTENIDVETVVEKYIFKPSDIVSLVAKDVDPEFATRDTFEIDTAISSRYNGTHMDQKPLERWDSTGDSMDNMCLELDSSANGWDANEMFRHAEAMGVQSTFDHSLAGYTMQIQKSDSHDFRKAELAAEKIAREIENQPMYDERADLENGDEESQFAAVVRPQGQSPHTFGGNAHSNSRNMSGGDGKGAVVSNASQKYVPPAKRKQGQQMGKLITPQTPPAPISSNSQPTTPQPVSTPPPLQQQQQVAPQQTQQQQPPPPLPSSVSAHGPPPPSQQGPGPKGHPGKGGYNAGPGNSPHAPPQAQQQQYAPNVHSTASNISNYNNQSGPPPQQQGSNQVPINGDQNNGNMQQQQQPPQVPTQSQQNVVHQNNNNNNNNQSNHNAHPSSMGGNNNKPHGQHQQQHHNQPPPPRHRSYPPPPHQQQQQQQQQHLPPNMYATEPPSMGGMVPAQMVLKAQPPPPHALVMVPSQGPQGQVMVVQGIAAPPPGAGNQKMMNSLPHRPPRGRDETVQDLKNFQDNYVLAGNPNASPGLAGQPPPMMHPVQSVYAPPPPTTSQPPPQAVPQDDIKSQGGVPSSPQPTSSLPPPVVHQGQRPGTTPSPANNNNNSNTHVSAAAPVRPAGQDNSNAAAAGVSHGQSTGPAENKQPGEVKKSVLNPQAKPFQPRTPITPNPSRPHTPQSAGAPQMVQGGPLPAMAGAPNGGAAQPAYPQPYVLKTQYGGNRMRFQPPPSAVQTATGSPLTMSYPYQLHHPGQHFQQHAAFPMFRVMAPDGQQTMQYMPSHSTTPSPGAQYHPQASPAGGGPSQPFPQQAGQQQFQTMMCPIQIPQTMQFHPNAQQPQYPNQYIIMPSQHPNHNQ